MPILSASPSRRFVRTWLAPAALALTVAVPAGAALAAPGRGEEREREPAFQSAGPCADAEEQAFLDLLNAYRAQNGLAPVRLSPTLSAAAESHSAEMANDDGYFDHTMLGGVSVGENLESHGYPDATYGENIAAGQGSADGVFSQWRNSAGHNANMLSANFDAVGVARAYDPSSGYGWYWTTIYGGTADDPAGCGGTRPAEIVEPTPEPEPTAEPTVEPTPEPTLEATGEPIAEPTPEEPAAIATEVAATSVPSPTAVPAATGAEAPVALPTLSPTIGPNAVATADLNLRAGPGADFPAFSTVPSGVGLTVTGPAEAGYLPVTADGRFGWVAADFVALQGVASPPVAAPSPAADGAAPIVADVTPAPAPATAPPAEPTTAASELLLRSGPSSDEAVLLVVPAGAALGLTGEASGDFLGATYGGVTGWADAAYLGS